MSTTAQNPSPDQIARVEAYLTTAYGLPEPVAKPIPKGVTNTNFHVSANNSEYVFKIYNFKEEPLVAFEVRVLNALREHHVTAPRIRKRTEETYVGMFDTRPCLLYEYIKGDILSEWNAGMLTQVGSYMGRMHVALRDFKDRTKCGTFDLPNVKRLVASAEPAFRAAGYPGARELLSFVQDELAALRFPADLPQGITHHDIKPENVVVQGGALVGVVDFDLTYWGVLLNDIATTIIWSCFQNEKLDTKRVEALVAGYEQERALTELEKQYLLQAVYYRLVREAFSSPFDVLPNHIDITKKRSLEFVELTKKYKQNKHNMTSLFRE